MCFLDGLRLFEGSPVDFGGCTGGCFHEPPRWQTVESDWANVTRLNWLTSESCQDVCFLDGFDYPRLAHGEKRLESTSRNANNRSPSKNYVRHTWNRFETPPAFLSFYANLANRQKRLNQLHPIWSCETRRCVFSTDFDCSRLSQSISTMVAPDRKWCSGVVPDVADLFCGWLQLSEVGPVATMTAANRK